MDGAGRHRDGPASTVVAALSVALVVLALALAGCGDDTTTDGSTESSTTGDDAGGGQTTTTAADDGGASDVVDDQLAVDWSSVGPPDEPATGADAIVGGAPDRTRALAIRSALESTGVDLTGLSLHVLPVTGTSEWLLVLGMTDDTALTESEDDDSDAFLLTLIDQMDQRGVNRLALAYRGTDEGEPIEITATASLADLQAAMADEVDPADVIRIQLERGS